MKKLFLLSVFLCISVTFVAAPCWPCTITGQYIPDDYAVNIFYECDVNLVAQPLDCGFGMFWDPASETCEPAYNWTEYIYRKP